jgi:hypothetical protein
MQQIEHPCMEKNKEDRSNQQLSRLVGTIRGLAAAAVVDFQSTTLMTAVSSKGES